MKEEKKRVPEPKTAEAASRKRAHQFGQPGANPQGNPGAAVDVRKFLRWAETEATEEELRAYANYKANPFFKRRMCELLLNKLLDVRDVSEMLNQTHGQPKQVIEQTSLPAIEIVLE